MGQSPTEVKKLLVINMATTITIKEDTKKVLATLKGNKDWDSFLKELAFESGSLATRRELIRKRLEELFVE